MLVEEHVQTARVFLDESDTLFGEGEVLQGSEKVWGAAAHAVMAIAQQRGWAYDSHRNMKNAVEPSCPKSTGDAVHTAIAFAVAEKFHINFYHHGHGRLSSWTLTVLRVRALVERLLTLYIGNDG